MEETEKTSNTSEYLKGIVLNLPEVRASTNT